MQNWAILSLVLGVIAGFLAFTSVPGAWAFMFTAVILLLVGVMLLMRRPRSRGMPISRGTPMR